MYEKTIQIQCTFENSIAELPPPIQIFSKKIWRVPPTYFSHLSLDTIRSEKDLKIMILAGDPPSKSLAKKTVMSNPNRDGNQASCQRELSFHESKAGSLHMTVVSEVLIIQDANQGPS